MFLSSLTMNGIFALFIICALTLNVSSNPVKTDQLTLTKTLEKSAVSVAEDFKNVSELKDSLDTFSKNESLTENVLSTLNHSKVALEEVKVNLPAQYSPDSVKNQDNAEQVNTYVSDTKKVTPDKVTDENLQNSPEVLVKEEFNLVNQSDVVTSNESVVLNKNLPDTYTSVSNNEPSPAQFRSDEQSGSVQEPEKVLTENKYNDPSNFDVKHQTNEEASSFKPMEEKLLNVKSEVPVESSDNKELSHNHEADSNMSSKIDQVDNTYTNKNSEPDQSNENLQPNSSEKVVSERKKLEKSLGDLKVAVPIKYEPIQTLVVNMKQASEHKQVFQQLFPLKYHNSETTENKNNEYNEKSSTGDQQQSVADKYYPSNVPLSTAQDKKLFNHEQSKHLNKYHSSNNPVSQQETYTNQQQGEQVVNDQHKPAPVKYQKVENPEMSLQTETSAKEQYSEKPVQYQPSDSLKKDTLNKELEGQLVKDHHKPVASQYQAVHTSDNSQSETSAPVQPSQYQPSDSSPANEKALDNHKQSEQLVSNQHKPVSQHYHTSEVNAKVKPQLPVEHSEKPFEYQLSKTESMNKEEQTEKVLSDQHKSVPVPYNVQNVEVNPESSVYVKNSKKPLQYAFSHSSMSNPVQPVLQNEQTQELVNEEHKPLPTQLHNAQSLDANTNVKPLVSDQAPEKSFKYQPDLKQQVKQFVNDYKQEFQAAVDQVAFNHQSSLDTKQPVASSVDSYKSEQTMSEQLSQEVKPTPNLALPVSKGVYTSTENHARNMNFEKSWNNNPSFSAFHSVNIPLVSEGSFDSSLVTPVKNDTSNDQLLPKNENFEEVNKPLHYNDDDLDSDNSKPLVTVEYKPIEQSESGHQPVIPVKYIPIDYIAIVDKPTDNVFVANEENVKNMPTEQFGHNKHSLPKYKSNDESSNYKPEETVVNPVESGKYVNHDNLNHEQNLNAPVALKPVTNQKEVSVHYKPVDNQETSKQTPVQPVVENYNLKQGSESVLVERNEPVKVNAEVKSESFNPKMVQPMMATGREEVFESFPEPSQNSENMPVPQESASLLVPMEPALVVESSQAESGPVPVPYSEEPMPVAVPMSVNPNPVPVVMSVEQNPVPVAMPVEANPVQFSAEPASVPVPVSVEAVPVPVPMAFEPAPVPLSMPVEPSSVPVPFSAESAPVTKLNSPDPLPVPVSMPVEPALVPVPFSAEPAPVPKLNSPDPVLVPVSMPVEPASMSAPVSVESLPKLETSPVNEEMSPELKVSSEKATLHNKQQPTSMEQNLSAPSKEASLTSNGAAMELSNPQYVSPLDNVSSLKNSVVSKNDPTMPVAETHYEKSSSDLVNHSSTVPKVNESQEVPFKESFYSSFSKVNKIGSKVQVKELIKDEVDPLPNLSVDSVADTMYDKFNHNSRDMSVYLSEPIDQTTKLLLDLEEQVKVYLAAEDDLVVSTVEPQAYLGGSSMDELTDSVERQQNQIQVLVDQVNRLAQNLESTITELVSRRRYVTAAMLRSVLNYLRRVRISLERLQNRLQTLQAAASSGQSSLGGSEGSSFPGAGFFNSIRDRINSITEEIGTLMTRIRASLTPASASNTSSSSSSSSLA